MDNKIILTIGRQFGSGGREIGQKLAKELGIGYYDKQLMALAAKESGLSEEFFEKADERASSGLAYAFTMGYSYMGLFPPYADVLSNDRLFLYQSDTIRNLAEKGSCVIVGRCALTYILRDDPDCRVSLSTTTKRTAPTDHRKPRPDSRAGGGIDAEDRQIACCLL